ncbi:MAG: Gfo/Idh/MocA family oxidoreductase [Spirochaeta sp.]|jgi:predicted dehydrogenase|nr:Gfo/Idh/MocA family oxidoreductase [Spirochaeta sp.]
MNREMVSAHLQDAVSIPVAFIGLGRIASLLENDPLREKPATHAGAVHAHPGCHIVGGYDRDESRRAAFEKRWNAPVYTDSTSLLATEPGIVVIATHPDSHGRFLEQAKAAGVPVAICEKPVAPTYRRARRLVSLERDGGFRVVVNHERRFSRDYQLAQRGLAAGEFGTLQGVHGRLYFGGAARHDRVLLHDGTHLIDAIHFLTGDRIVLTRKAGRYRSARGTVYLHGHFAGQPVPVVIEVGSGRRYLHFETVLSGSDGEVRVGNGIFEWKLGRPSPFYEQYRSLIDSNRFPPAPSGYFSGMISEAVRLYQNDTARSRSSLADGLAAMRVIRDAGRLW